MDKGKTIMGSAHRWAVKFTDNSTSSTSRDIPDPPSFTRASHDPDDSAVSVDAELNWNAQLNTLGLFPTHVSDWVSSLAPAPAEEVEYSGGGIPLYEVLSRESSFEQPTQ